jgi:DNA-binding NarL/FixJ family response regulator
MSDPADVAPFGSPLSAREIEVIEAYRRLGSYEAVALELEIVVGTVRVHLANARSRRGVRKSWQLFGELAA